MNNTLKIAGAVSVVAVLPACVTAAEKKPNVILIMADDVGYECFGAYGSKQYKTPVLDKMAEEGVRFTHAYSQPLCTPTRVKIMTGMSNIRNYHDFSILGKGEKTFGHMMKQAGYATGIVGKWQLHGAKHYGKMAGKGMHPSDSGFDNYCLWQIKDLGSRFWKPLINTDGDLKQYPKEIYGPGVLNDYACNFIEKNRDKPFFLYYPMVLVHDPFVPTPDSEDKKSKNKQKNFEDMMTYMDKCVGKVLAKLEEQGILDNTLVMFTGDNGTHSTIKSKLNGKVIRGGKGLTTDAGTRVPLIVQWPGKTPKGKVCEDLIDFTDFMPTVAETAGAKLPEGTLDGVSFLSQIKGEKGTPRETVFCYYNPRPTKGTKKFTPRCYARDKRWKLYRDGRLFDVKNDVLETTPIKSPEVAEIRKKLQKVLDSMPAKPQKINSK